MSRRTGAMPPPRMFPLAFAAVFVAIGAATAVAMPSLDPKYRTTVAGPDGTTVVLARDPFDPLAWYYLPAGLRLAEDEAGRPKFRFTRWVENARQYGILQFAVRGDVDAGTVQRMREAAVEWFRAEHRKDPSVAVPAPAQIRLSPVGPLKLANLHPVLIRGNGVEVVLPAAAGRPAADPDARVGEPASADRPGQDGGPGEPPAVVRAADGIGRMGVLPGVTELTSEAWVQYDLSGPVVQVAEALVTGRSPGGLVVLYQGKYLAYAPEMSCEIELDVDAVAKFFRDHHEERSRWGFLFFGGEKHSVKDFFESRAELRDTLKVKRIGGGSLTPAEWDKIETRLHSWVTREVFEPTQTSVQAGQAAQAPGAAAPQAPANVGPLAGVALGVPQLASLNLALGYSSGAADLQVRASAGYSRSSKARWSGHDVVDADVVLFGAVGLQKYDQAAQQAVLGRPLELADLGRVIVSVPLASSDALERQYRDSEIVLDGLPGGQTRVLSYDEATDAWKAAGDALGNSVPYGGGFALVFGPTADTSHARARWRLRDANAAVPTDRATPAPGLPTIEIEATADATGSIHFGRDAFPFRPVTVDASALVAGGILWTGLKASVSLDMKYPGGKVERLNLPALDDGHTSVPCFVAGEIRDVNLRVVGTIDDAFRGAVHVEAAASADSTAAWRSEQRRSVNEGASYVALTPATLGIHRYGIGLGRLAAEPSVVSVRCIVRSAAGHSADRAFALKEGGWVDLDTNVPLPVGTFWLTTFETPAEVTAAVTYADGRSETLSLPAEVVRQWAEADGRILPLAR